MRRLGLVLSLLCSGCLFDQCGAVSEVAELELPPVETPCRELRTPIALSKETEFGRPEDVLRWIDGYHTGELLWSGTGNRTTIEIETWDPHAFLVESHPPAGYVARNNDRSCIDRIDIEVQVALSTRDHRLDGEQGKLVLRAAGDVDAFGSMYIAWNSFLGTYQPTLDDGLCFQGLLIKVLLGVDGFNGSLNDDYARGSCETTSGEIRTQRIAGHWGRRWQSY
jgi:hypothetical protein